MSIVMTKKMYMMQNQPSVIQTKPERQTVVVNNEMLRCKRKINFTHLQPYNGAPVHMQPASVARRNARERNRVKQVNNGFATLRQHIPPSVAAALSTQTSTQNRSGSKKLSKVETLRMAVEYIRSLQQMIQDHEEANQNSQASMLPPIKSEIKRSIKSEQYYTNQSDLGQFMEAGDSHYVILQQTPPCSEASVSPTPSYGSESSVSAPSTNSYTPLTVYQPTEGYENYEPMSPEDEELLDVISWWQQQ